MRRIIVWLVIALVLSVPLALSMTSPLLAWRDAIYVAAGVAGVIAMSLMFVQPLLGAGHLPGVALAPSRRAHRWFGGILVVAVVVHVAALWITSPPDVVDALLFASPTPFSVWGVVAMWALFAAALLAVLRKTLKLRPQVWRFGHTMLVSVVVLGTVIHALLIQGTMESVSKWVLAGLVLLALGKVIADLKVWKALRRR